jgi:hypothetical protein
VLVLTYCQNFLEKKGTTSSDAELRLAASPPNSNYSAMSVSKKAKSRSRKSGNDDIKFPLFSKLAGEIQDMIWEAAITIEPARVLEVIMRPYVSETTHPLASQFTFSTKIGCHKIPSLLSVCFRARTVALKSYQLNVGEVIQNQQVFFNFERDTLLFNMVPQQTS